VFIEHVDLPRGLDREHVHTHDHDYTLRGSETRTLTTVGAFRVVPASDLRDSFGQPLDPRQGELWHLRESGLVDTVQLDRDNTVARGAGVQRVAGRIRALVAAMNPNLPILGSQTLEEQLMSGPVTLQLRMAATVSASVGLIGLVLAAVGIYGVTAYAAVRRTREIGIRLALGGQRLEVAGLIVRQGMSLVALGSAIGLLLAVVASRLLRRLLFGAPPVDPVTFAAATLVFAAVGLAACYVPARRAVGVDPVNALRHE
jgi:ABC-type antimicrobial peptide transport system permease subunit